jgi:gas vesicle protein
MNNNSRNSSGSLGMFLAGAITAAAVGGYMLFGSKKSKRNREMVEDWIEGAKDELWSEIENIKDITRDKFDEVMERIIDKYSKMKEDWKDSKNKNVKKLRQELESVWDEVEEERQQGE